MPISRRLLSLCGSLLLATTLGGCASTSITQYHAGESRSVCQDDGKVSPILILWGAAWRKDQHHRGEREATAERGIRRYFARGDCFRQAYIAGQAMGRSPLTLSDIEMIRWARAQSTPFSTLIQIRVEELDVENNRSVAQLRVRVLDMTSMRMQIDRTAHRSSSGLYMPDSVALDEAVDETLTAIFTQQFSRY